MQWGAHIMGFRFTQERSPADLERYFDMFEKSPKGLQGNPESIDVGYFTMDRNGFSLKTLERFALS